MKQMRAGITQIWQEAFNEEEAYIQFFLNNGWPLGEILTIGPKDHPYSALILFPISYHQAGVSYSGYYLYALGTLLSQRKKGYASELMLQAASFAMEHHRSFILLQPTHPSLFTYYTQLGYNHRIYRSNILCSRSIFSTNSEKCSVFKLLSHLAVPCETMCWSHEPINRFVWSPPLRDYIRKECLFRGGMVLDGSYCYPNRDADGLFVEVKEFRAENLSILVESILTHFPHHHRILFYGTPNQLMLAKVTQAPFALVRFFDPNIEPHYNPYHSYFGLGLD